MSPFRLDRELPSSFRNVLGMHILSGGLLLGAPTESLLGFSFQSPHQSPTRETERLLKESLKMEDICGVQEHESALWIMAAY